MTGAELMELADHCDGASGPDRNLDMMIHARNGADGIGAYGDHPAYTASIDAALSLLPPKGSWRRLTENGASVYAASPYNAASHVRYDGFNEHVPLALCAAILRLRAAPLLAAEARANRSAKPAQSHWEKLS